MSNIYTKHYSSENKQREQNIYDKKYSSKKRNAWELISSQCKKIYLTGFDYIVIKNTGISLVFADLRAENSPCFSIISVITFAAGHTVYGAGEVVSERLFCLGLYLVFFPLGEFYPTTKISTNVAWLLCQEN